MLVWAYKKIILRTLNKGEDRDPGLSNTMIVTQHLTTVPNFLVEKKGKSEPNRTERESQ
jgi:hypothetical protein